VTTSELPGLLALVSLGLFTLASFCFAAAGATVLFRALRRPRPPAADWDDLDRACCLRGWESRGQVHDPRHCTRTDITR
jgi:hypothetical protein